VISARRRLRRGERGVGHHSRPKRYGEGEYRHRAECFHAGLPPGSVDDSASAAIRWLAVFVCLVFTGTARRVGMTAVTLALVVR
jgi:hypothetical protein